MAVAHSRKAWIILIGRIKTFLVYNVMNEEEIKSKISKTLKSLEDSGDIVITTTMPNLVVDKVVGALGGNVQSTLNDDEFRAVLNSLNVLAHDIKLDSRDFQTIIGIEKEELKVVFDKLNAS